MARTSSKRHDTRELIGLPKIMINSTIRKQYISRFGQGLQREKEPRGVVKYDENESARQMGRVGSCPLLDIDPQYEKQN